MTNNFKLNVFLRRPGVGLLGVLAIAGAYLGALQVTGNFHAVVPGKLYRSGQLSPIQIAEYAKKYEIRTIINLRGAKKGSFWYDAEVAETNRLGMRHIDFGISARRELTSSQADALIALMKTAQTPILIHCEGGADRSGLASALYMAAVAQAGEVAAEAQISIRYGHLPLPFIPEYAMDRTFEMLEPALGFPNS